MRYVMTQKVLSFGDDFTIKDEHKQDCFHIVGKRFSLGDKLSLRDMQGNEVARIERDLISWDKWYRILRGNKPIGAVKKQSVTQLRDVFDVEGSAAGELDAEGDFVGREYVFTRDGKPIATISKKLFDWPDTYGIEIGEGEDEALILACAVVIDICSHDD